VGCGVWFWVGEYFSLSFFFFFFFKGRIPLRGKLLSLFIKIFLQGVKIHFLKEKVTRCWTRVITGFEPALILLEWSDFDHWATRGSHHPRAKAREVPALHGLDRSLHTRKSHPKNLNFKKKRLNVYVLSANRRPKGIRTQPRNFFLRTRGLRSVQILNFVKKSCQKSIFWPKNMDPGHAFPRVGAQKTIQQPFFFGL